MIVELTINEHPDEEYTGKQRQGYEQLLRKLLKLPSRPAVMQARALPPWAATCAVCRWQTARVEPWSAVPCASAALYTAVVGCPADLCRSFGDVPQ